MDVRERLFQELETVCKGAELDFEKTSRELSELIGSDGVIDYYIAQAPLPNFPDTVLDIMVLSGKCLYDYEVRQNERSLRHMLRLSAIVEITEAFSEVEQEFLTLTFAPAGFGTGLVLQDKLSKSGNLHRFSSAVRRKILEGI